MWNLLTKRCYLRDYEEADREGFVRINTDPVARQHLDGPLSLSEAHDLFEATVSETDPAQGVRLAIFDRKSNEYLGHLFFVPWEDQKDEMEWGLLLKPEYWGRGLASEVGEAATHECFRRFGLQRMYATTGLEHTASVQVLKRLGFTLVGRCQDDAGFYGVFTLDQAMRLTPREALSLATAKAS